MNGTSMASPIVAGSVALMKSLNKNLTTEQIIEILQNTGIKTKDPIGNIIQLDAALRAVQSGDYGKKNSSDNNLTKPSEKLRTDDFLRDVTNIYGMWKSSKQLHSSNGNNIDLYMYFAQYNSRLIIVETSNNNKQYVGDFQWQIKNDSLFITQTQDAYAVDGTYYTSNIFTCTTDKKGYLACDAYDINYKPLLVQFNLIKVK